AATFASTILAREGSLTRPTIEALVDCAHRGGVRETSKKAMLRTRYMWISRRGIGGVIIEGAYRRPQPGSIPRYGYIPNPPKGADLFLVHCQNRNDQSESWGTL